MNEKKFALGIGIAGCAFIALLVYLTAPDLAPRAPVVLLPASGTSADAGARSDHSEQAPMASPSHVVDTVADCSTARLDSWWLIGVEAGAYRQGGFAVLNNDRRGTLTIAESQMFDGNLMLAKVSANAVEIRCGQSAQTKVLADSRSAADAVAPAMRTALPAPPDN